MEFSIEDYIIKHKFNPDLILKNILNISDDLWTEHKWYGNFSNQFSTLTDCVSQNFYPKSEDFLLIKINKIVEEVFKIYSKKFPLVQLSKSSLVRYNKYNIGSNMNLHVDHIHSLFDGINKGIPIITALFLLNDNFEGGEFYMHGRDYNLKAGECIVFPSSFMYPHEVKKITKGVRYSASIWMW